MAKLLAFSGSARKESYNQKLVAQAARIAEEQGNTVTLINLAELEMPLFNQDLESAHGMPANAKAFKTLLTEHNGFLIASPEYNGAFSPLLKNALDWASRSESKDEPGLSAYRNKTAAIMAASPGGLGGMRGLVMLRMLLNNLGILVLPQQITLSAAYSAFDDRGQLNDDEIHQELTSLVKKLSRAIIQTN